MNPNQPSEAMGISNLDQCYTCGGPTYVDPPGNTEVLVTCIDQECGLTRLCKDTRADPRLFILTWDTHAETHTVDSLREKFGKTNLFDGDGVWTVDKLPSNYRGWDMSQCSTLDDVFAVIGPGEQWTCDNCTVSLAEVITHDEKEMFQGYHGPSFKGVFTESDLLTRVVVTESVPLCLECVNTIGGASGEPDFAWHHTVHGEECGADDHAENTDESFQWNEDGTLNKYPDDCEDEELGRELDGLASDDPEVRKESLERLKRREGGAA